MTEPPNDQRRRFLVKGQVQGVGFRWWTRQEANALGLRGTVRNLANDTVLVDAAGSPEALQQFRDRLRIGPAAATVTEIEELDAPAGALPTDFQIIH